MRPPWTDLDPAGRAAWTRARLARLEKALPSLADPPASSSGTGRRPAPSSRIPGSVDAISLQAEIRHDLAYWCRELAKADDTLDLGDTDGANTLELLDVIRFEIEFIATWVNGERCAWEISDLADEAARVAWPREKGVFELGECTNTIGVDGVSTVCGATVRASARNVGDVKCRRCGLVDTMDGWMLRIVGDAPLVTAEQLVPILHKRLGVVVSPTAIRQWVARGELVPAGRTVPHGRGRPADLFDRNHAFLVVTRREGQGA